jgi:hypothetical protein
MKKIYIDKRVTTNGRKSKIEVDNSLDLNKHIEEVVNTLNITSNASGISYDNTVSNILSNNVQSAIDELAWITKKVTIKAAAITTCGTNPIPFLAAPGVDKYYVYEIDLKKPAVTSVVGGLMDYFYIGTDTQEGSIMQVSDYNSPANLVFQYESRNGINTNLPVDVIPVYPITTNEAIVFTTYNGSNPTSAVGNIELEVRYKIKEF